MDIIQTVKELFEPTFAAVGDSELDYDQKRAILYNLYCFACAVYPGYVAAPADVLFEYGCCFLLEPERHPDYSDDKPEFKRSAASDDVVPGGGRWYIRRGKDFIKYDFGSPLFLRLIESKVIPPKDRSPIPQISLYAAVYLVCNMFKDLRPLWYTYYFYLDATNEPVDEEFDEKLWELLRCESVYKGALDVPGSMLIGDESELGVGKLADFYKPFIAYRREHIFDVFEKRIERGDHDFVAEYSTELLRYYPESVNLMNWNAAARTECIVRGRDEKALVELIRDLREYAEASNSEVVKKYLKLAELMKKNLG
ncbi:MAG: hypothetical protein J1G38_02885 [Clostridiales bacterium]|nr:hypothetical protein [Clostridiales bacterium]